jgi:SH3 domain-containing YSC84-like protein 1
MMALEGASVGFQIGAQATDFVILVMNLRGATAILSSKVKLGADVAAGPGRCCKAVTQTGLKISASTLAFRRKSERFRRPSVACG